ncbi:MAG TPA: GPW/gp25 family protein [Polyangiaceae bacterium]|nr:GPW/gp25 family protein [Polyangiaceae bacterium]
MARALYSPFQIGALGQPRSASRERAVQQQIEQVLFTLPGERVNRPDFGCGVQRLVFAGATPEIAAAAEYVIRVGLTRFLSDVIRVDAVRVTADDAALFVDVLYTLEATGEEASFSASRPLEGGAA